MSIEITDLTALDETQVAQSFAQTVQRLQEANPTLYLRRGVFHDLLAYMHALLDAQVRGGLIGRYLSARSLLDVQADPTLADADVVDALLSNFRVARGTGAAARGEVTVVLSQPYSVTVGSGAVFTANGKTYHADSAFTAKPEAGQINSDSDRLLTRLDDGNYAFTITVTADAAGTDSLVTKNTLVVPSALPNGYVTSFATDDFTGGLDAETNDELLTRLQQGVSCKAPSNRVNMQAMLRDRPEFARVVHSSVVGYGDPEMIRDQHSVLPLSLGGRCDWYVRTAERLVRLTLARTCTLVSVDAEGRGTWQFELGRDDAPGFYEVVSVLPPGARAVDAGTLPVVADVRGLDLTDDGEFVPDVETVAEGAYSRYQTAAVRFTDTTADQSALAAGATATYDVTVSLVPQVAAVQDYVGGRDVRSYGADVLVKAPVPCFVTVDFRVAKRRTQSDPDVQAIKDAVARAVNNVDFTGRLYAAHLQDVIGGFLAEGMSAGAVDMFGRIRRPDGRAAYVRSTEVLVVPSTDDGSMVSPNTVQFFCDPDAVNVEVSTEIPTPQ